MPYSCTQLTAMLHCLLWICLLWICLPWLYLLSQLIGMLSHLYCFSVPITFITSFSYAICVPTFVMALVYFGMPRALRPPALTLTY